MFNDIPHVFPPHCSAICDHTLEHQSVSPERASMISLDRELRLPTSRCDMKTDSSDLPAPQEVSKQPLQGLKLASHGVLEEAQQRGRLKCSKCGGSRMFFCYTCCTLVGVTQQDIPLIKVSKRSQLT